VGAPGRRSAARAAARRPILSVRRTRWLLAALFVGLLAAFAVGLWGTILRPAAYEVRGVVVARPAANMILIRHEAAPGLGMGAMELMAVFSDPARLDAADPHPGDRVRLAVRRTDDQIDLIRLEKVP
jgi:hypothetical protein